MDGLSHPRYASAHLPSDTLPERRLEVSHTAIGSKPRRSHCIDCAQQRKRSARLSSIYCRTLSPPALVHCFSSWPLIFMAFGEPTDHTSKLAMGRAALHESKLVQEKGRQLGRLFDHY